MFLITWSAITRRLDQWQLIFFSFPNDSTRFSIMLCIFWLWLLHCHGHLVKFTWKLPLHRGSEAGLRERGGVEGRGRGVVQVPGPHRDGQVSSVELLKIKVLAAAEITVISIITLLGFHGQVQRLLLHTEHGAVQARAAVLLLAGPRLPIIYTSPGGRTMLGGRAEVSCAGAALRVSGAWSREPAGGTQRPAWCRHTGAACDAREMARERGCGAWARGPGPLAEMGRRRVTSEHFITGPADTWTLCTWALAICYHWSLVKVLEVWCKAVQRHRI